MRDFNCPILHQTICPAPMKVYHHCCSALIFVIAATASPVHGAFLASKLTLSIPTNSSCEGLLFTTVDGITHFNPRISWILNHVKTVYQQKNRLRWDSQFLTDKPISDISRLNEIFEMLRVEDSALRREVNREAIAPLGGIRSQALWDRYLGGPYIRVATFVPEFLQIALRASSYLPEEGIIADLGSGPGILAAVLAAEEPSRHIEAHDWSPLAIAMAKDLMSSLPWVHFDISQTNLETFNPQTTNWQGAFINNVAYAIQNKESLLRGVFKALVPGATFVINDLPERAMNPQAQITVQEEILRQSFMNGGPLDEFDVAFVMVLNYDTLMRNTWSTERLIDLAKHVGFEVLPQQDSEGKFHTYIPTYYFIDNFVVFRKPVAPTQQK